MAGQVFSPFSFGDVVIGLQDSDRLSALVLLQRPAARHGDLRSVSLRVDEFPLPATSAEQLRGNLFTWRRKNRVQELVSNLTERLLPDPAVQLLGATIPERNDVVHTAYEDRVVREVQELGPLTQRGLRTLALGQVEHEGHALVPGSRRRSPRREARARDCRLSGSTPSRKPCSFRCLKLCRRSLCRVAPLTGRQRRPAHATGDEIVSIVSDMWRKASLASIIWPSASNVKTPMMLESTRRRTFASRSCRSL